MTINCITLPRLREVLDELIAGYDVPTALITFSYDATGELRVDVQDRHGEHLHPIAVSTEARGA